MSYIWLFHLRAGTWTFSYYSSPDYNGNADGQGSGVSYAAINSVWAALMLASSAGGANGCSLAPGGGPPAEPLHAFFPQGTTIFATPTFDPELSRDFTQLPSSATATVTTAAPGLYQYAMAGITSAFFPTKKVGVAVGLNLGRQLPAALLMNSQLNYCDNPSIILSFDSAASWVLATAVPSFTEQPAAQAYAPTATPRAVGYPVRGIMNFVQFLQQISRELLLTHSTCSILPAETTCPCSSLPSLSAG